MQVKKALLPSSSTQPAHAHPASHYRAVHCWHFHAAVHLYGLLVAEAWNLHSHPEGLTSDEKQAKLIPGVTPPVSKELHGRRICSSPSSNVGSSVSHSSHTAGCDLFFKIRQAQTTLNAVPVQNSWQDNPPRKKAVMFLLALKCFQVACSISEGFPKRINTPLSNKGHAEQIFSSSSASGALRSNLSHGKKVAPVGASSAEWLPGATPAASASFPAARRDGKPLFYPVLAAYKLLSSLLIKFPSWARAETRPWGKGLCTEVEKVTAAFTQRARGHPTTPTTNFPPAVIQGCANTGCVNWKGEVYCLRGWQISAKNWVRINLYLHAN